jgi:signal transduction histidine kinase
LGVIKFERYLGKDPFTPRDKERLDQWSELITLTLQGMISREGQERNRQEALRELSSKLLVPASRTYYEDIVKLTAQILNADICTMWLVDEKKQKLSLAAQVGLNPETIAIAMDYDIPKSKTVPDSEIHGLTVWVVVRNRPFFAQNWDKLKEHPSHKGYWDAAQWNSKPDRQFGCLYAAPLLVEDKPIGVLKVERRKRQDFQSFNEVERATFDHIAMTVSVAPPLKAVIRDRDDLVLDYFHILRAPTSNAITALESLRKELQEGKDVRMKRVESRLNMLADNLAVAYTQTLNAFEAATLPEKAAAPSWRNLSKKLINSSTEMLRRLFPEVDIQISQKTEDFELSLTDFQLKRLNVVIHNLVDNAIAFSDKKPVRIEVSPDSKNGCLILSVIDNGIGIPANKIEQIWQPGFTSRSDAMTRPESRGQGLTSVSNILEEFGWHRTLVTVPGKGTTIHIYIKKDYWRKVA